MKEASVKLPLTRMDGDRGRARGRKEREEKQSTGSRVRVENVKDRVREEEIVERRKGGKGKQK